MRNKSPGTKSKAQRPNVKTKGNHSNTVTAIQFQFINPRILNSIRKKEITSDEIS
jgi:hypothetical protein